MTNLWRISNYVDLSGEGGLGSLWAMAYRGTAGCLSGGGSGRRDAGAHCSPDGHERGWDSSAFLSTFADMRFPMSLQSKHLNTLAPADWKERLEFTRAIGDAWLASRETPLAKVPSAIVPANLELPSEPRASRCQSRCRWPRSSASNSTIGSSDLAPLNRAGFEWDSGPAGAWRMAAHSW